MSFQAIQQISGQTMVAQSTRLTLAAEALSYSGIPASSPNNILQPGIAMIKATPVNIPASTLGNTGQLPTYGAEVTQIIKSNTPAIPRYQPGHPLANTEGEVFYPDISSIQVMTDMMTAARDFNAAVSIFNTSRQMQGQVLELVTI